MASLKHVNLIIMKSVWRVASTLLLFLTLNCCKDFSSIMNTNDEHNCIVPTDTTSHDFTWVVDTLGDYGSSLRDVAIISENEVWAVGELVISGITYNAVRFDGSVWNYIRIPMKIWNTSDTIPAPLQSITASGPNDIWVTTGGEVAHFDGNDWGEWHFLFNDLNDPTFGGISRFWMNNSSEIWAVGKKGNLFHYNGSSWSRLNNISTEDLNDIAGYTDPKTGQTRIWVAGTRVLLYSNNGMNWQIVMDENNQFLPAGYVNPTTVYIPNECYVYITVFGTSGNGLFRIDQPDVTKYELLASLDFGIRGSKASSQNDILMAGSFNGVAHYNGKTIKTFPELMGDGFFTSVAVFNGEAFIAGITGSSFRGIIARGIR